MRMLTVVLLTMGLASVLLSSPQGALQAGQNRQQEMQETQAAIDYWVEEWATTADQARRDFAEAQVRMNQEHLNELQAEEQGRCSEPGPVGENLVELDRDLRARNENLQQLSQDMEGKTPPGLTPPTNPWEAVWYLGRMHQFMKPFIEAADRSDAYRGGTAPECPPKGPAPPTTGQRPSDHPRGMTGQLRPFPSGE